MAAEPLLSDVRNLSANGERSDDCCEPILLTASRRSSIARCAYVPVVVVTDACRSTRCTRCGSTPARSMSVAAVWRRSWNRIFDFSGRGHNFMLQRGQCRRVASACRLGHRAVDRAREATGLGGCGPDRLFLGRAGARIESPRRAWLPDAVCGADPPGGVVDWIMRVSVHSPHPSFRRRSMPCLVSG